MEFNIAKEKEEEKIDEEDTQNSSNGGIEMESDEIERSKIGIMRALTEQEDPSVKVLSINPILHFVYPFHFLVIFVYFQIFDSNV